MKNKQVSLGGRMKRYEASGNIALTRRTPVILRLDGVKFSKFTKGFLKPFDKLLMTTMQQTLKALCGEIQGCVFGYTQSDEMTLVLVDYQRLESDAWFDYDVSKLCSVAASTATMYFNKFFIENVRQLEEDTRADVELFYSKWGWGTAFGVVDVSVYERKFFTAKFDCRAFNVPKEDVCNCVLWRQQDAERNSVQMLAQSLYSHRELQGVNNKELQNKMFTEQGVNWSKLPVVCKRGSGCRRLDDGKWHIDYNIPQIKLERQYVQEYVEIG